MGLPGLGGGDVGGGGMLKLSSLLPRVKQMILFSREFKTHGKTKLTVFRLKQNF